MKIAALQMCSTPRVEDNLATASQLIAEAAQAGAELVALPEYFCLMGHHDADKLAIAEPFASGTPSPTQHPLQHFLSNAAKQHGICLIGGTIPLRADSGNKAFNTTLVYNQQGQVIARYDKIHLFCFDDGNRRYDEAATLQPGHQPVAFDWLDRQGQSWRIGLSICYDLRFPELFRKLGETQPLDLIVLPAAFTETTGKAHWELLLRARAVENLCHVLAPAQGGLHENGRSTFGHAMVIGPWGDVINVHQNTQTPGVTLGQLNRTHQTQVRTQLPALQHRVFGP